jgi:two-component system phosphate regulon sensor histidine kinase PhoR
MRALLTSTATIAVVPLVAILLLAVQDGIAASHALVAGGAVLLTAGGLAWLWQRDMASLTTTLQVAARADRPGEDVAMTGGPARPVTRPRPLLPGTAVALNEMDRLARHAAIAGQRASRQVADERAVVDRLPDPVILLGADRQIRRANQAARMLFGDDLGAVLRVPALRAAIDRALSDGAAHSADLSLNVPIERELTATVYALTQRDHEQPPGPAGALPPSHAILCAVLSDRTRDRAVERMRADFVANASHELRTPLASLLGFIETLQGPARDDLPAQERFLAIMSEQAHRMNRLIDDLLSLSRIELTEHQPPEGRADLAGLVQRQAAAFEPRVTARRIDLRLELDPLPPVPGDADQITQVLQNLMDNAVKYGREGGVVQVTLGRAPPGGRWPGRPGVLLSVRDDGHGIPRADIPRLTERFYRVDKGRSRAVGGTGLGLAIVKHIVNRHRGQMLIESEEGAGTAITIWLPSLAQGGRPARTGADGAAGRA